MNQISIPIVKLPNAADLPLPAYLYDLALGAELLAAINAPIRLGPGERVLVPTGICLALPLGVEAQVRTHSQTALSRGLTICDAPACIDPSFRDEVKCLVTNISSDIVIVKRGMPVATLHLAPAYRAVWQEMSSAE